MNFSMDTIIHAKEIMRSLADGIDPTSNIALPNDTILNSFILKKCFRDTSDILELLENNPAALSYLCTGKKHGYKSDFSIQENELPLITLNDTPITISHFVFCINKVCNHEKMKKLQATQITEWLTNHGYLEKVNYDNDLYKKATEAGQKLGITYEEKTNTKGIRYITNYYNKAAQEFILKHVIPELNSIQ